MLFLYIPSLAYTGCSLKIVLLFEDFKYFPDSGPCSRFYLCVSVCVCVNDRSNTSNAEEQSSEKSYFKEKTTIFTEHSVCIYEPLVNKKGSKNGEKA